MSKYLRKLSSGLIYQEDFDNVDPWTRWSGVGSISIDEGKLKFNTTAIGSWYVNSIGNLKNSFVQMNVNVNITGRSAGPICRMKTVDNDYVYSLASFGVGPGDQDDIAQMLNGNPTALGNYTHGSAQRGISSYYDIFQWISEGNWRLFCDCNEGGHTISDSNCTQLATDKIGLMAVLYSPVSPARVARYNIMTDKSIECSGMHEGWKLRIDEDDTYKATESGGTATVDCFDLIFPVSKVELLDGSDIVQDTFELSNAIWAGDRFEAGSYKYNLDTDALAFRDLCRIDVDGVPGSWF